MDSPLDRLRAVVAKAEDQGLSLAIRTRAQNELKGLGLSIARVLADEGAVEKLSWTVIGGMHPDASHDDSMKLAVAVLQAIAAMAEGK